MAYMLDACLIALDAGLRTLTGSVRARRASPAAGQTTTLDEADRRVACGLVRVNHCGEICAQALYQGQALAARDDKTRTLLREAAGEEEDHLAWCRERLRELDGRPSVLDPAFYCASFLLGAATGLCGDRVSLAFLEATEDEVGRHLDRHLERLPAGDAKSRAIFAAMRDDEERHRQSAARAEPAVFPRALKRCMGLLSRVMTAATYRI